MLSLPRVKRAFQCCISVSLVSLAFLFVSEPAMADEFRVFPERVELNGNFTRTQLVVRAVDASKQVTDRTDDYTHAATYSSSNPAVVTVSETGRILAVSNGEATVKVSVEGVARNVPIKVAGVVEQPKIGFREHVSPILSKHGCNMGACHASQFGKGGFKLSVFGFQPSPDRTAIVRDRRQRRLNMIDPDKSLFLRKPTMQMPHGGGLRLKKRSVDYEVLKAWIANGAPGPGKAAKVTKLTVTPTRRVAKLGTTQQLRVDAEFSDGSVQDVTALAKYDSMDEAMLSVNVDGMVTASLEGQAPIMVRFEGQAQIAMFVAPYDKPIQLAGWKNNNFVDELAVAKFRELRIEPSGLCDDATFLRRAFLDCIGTLPTIDETVAFLASKEANKREKLIDQLLGLTGDSNLDIYNDQYAAYWALKWSDLIRNSSNKVGEQGMWAMHNWIKESFRVNKPFDKFVTELVTAKGSIYKNGPANYYRINSNASLLTESTAQLFLGIRLECAKCHHHPFEKYSQSDYNNFGQFFSQVRSKNSEEFGLFGRETVVTVQPNPATKATHLDGESISHPLDIRIPFAGWLTSKDNQYFAQSVVNRYVSYLLGRGLVNPVDDLRSTNPPTNVALMHALAEHFTGNRFDLKQLIRAIMVSRLYQLDSQPTEANVGDRRFFSYYQVKRIPAESLLDAIDFATGAQTKFTSLPLGTRAIELPDAGDIYRNYFLKTFAKPRRASVCECERSSDENLAQALHTLIGDLVAGKIADGKGRVARLLKEKKSHEDIVKDLYLATLSRYPTDAERAASEQFLQQIPDKTECYQDLLWALINSKQFLFVH